MPWLWKEVTRLGLKEAQKLLTFTGNHLVLELYGTSRLI